MGSKHRIGIVLLLVMTLVLTSSLLAAGQSEIYLPLVTGNEQATSAEQDAPGAQETPELAVVEEAVPTGTSEESSSTQALPVEETMQQAESVSAQPQPEAPAEDDYAAEMVAPAAITSDVINWTVRDRLGVGTDQPQARLDINGAGGRLQTNGDILNLIGLNGQATNPHLSYIAWRQPDGTRAMYLGYGLTTVGSRRVDMGLENNYNLAITGGRVSIGSTSTPNHLLSVLGGPNWTTSSWHGAVELANQSAIGWRSNTAGQRFGLGHTDSGFYIFRTASDPGTAGSPPIYDLAIKNNGFVGIGTTSPLSKLSVANGSIRVTNGSFIDDGTTLNVPDYVFEQDYPLMSLDELAAFVAREKHLPGVPSQDEIHQEGLNLSQFHMRLLEKVEELTLYTLAQQEQLNAQQTQIEALQQQQAGFEARLTALEQQ